VIPFQRSVVIPTTPTLASSSLALLITPIASWPLSHRPPHARPSASTRRVLGWPKRCKLVHAFLSVGMPLEKVEVVPTSGPTRRLPHFRVELPPPALLRRPPLVVRIRGRLPPGGQGGQGFRGAKTNDGEDGRWPPSRTLRIVWKEVGRCSVGVRNTLDPLACGAPAATACRTRSGSGRSCWSSTCAAKRQAGEGVSLAHKNAAVCKSARAFLWEYTLSYERLKLAPLQQNISCSAPTSECG
jgi:hypothetical protein